MKQAPKKERWWTRLNDWWNGPVETRRDRIVLKTMQITALVLIGLLLSVSVDHKIQKNNLIISDSKSLSFSKENPNTIQSGACTTLKNCPLYEESYLRRLNSINVDTPFGVMTILNSLIPLPASKCKGSLSAYIEPIYPSSTSLMWSTKSTTLPSKLCSDLQSSNILMYFDILSIIGNFTTNARSCI